MIRSSDDSKTDEGWRDLDEVFDRVAKMSHADTAPLDFYGTMMTEAQRVSGAEGSAAWRIDGGDISVLWRDNVSVDVDQSHARFARQAIEQGGATIITAGSNSGQGDELADRASLFCAVASPDQDTCVVELILPKDLTPGEPDRQLELLKAFCEIAADYERNRSLRRWRQRDQFWTDVDRFSQRVHQHLEFDRTAYEVVNEACRLVGGDRASLAIRRHGRFDLVAVSGQDIFDRRAEAVRLLERLAGHVAMIGEPLWYSGNSGDLLPPIQERLDEYVHQSHVRVLTAVPLYRDVDSDKPAASRSIPFGMLIFECFGEPANSAEYPIRVKAVCRHASSAIFNASQFSRGLASRWLRKLDWFADWRRTTALAGILLLMIAAIAVLTFVKSDFYVQGVGELQPEIRRRVFAPQDGEIQQLMVRHGDRVRRGDILLTMRSADLDADLTRLLGEIQTTAEQLASVQAARLSMNPVNPQQRAELSRMTADEERMRKSLESLRKQHEIVQQQKERLKIASPIDGQILTWDLRQKLPGARPVRRGQVLMAVGGIDQEWLIEIQIPDRHAGYVMDASRRAEGSLPVEFVLATEPGTKYDGEIDQIARRSEVDDFGTARVRVIVRFDKDKVASLRPGAEIRASVYCGRKPLGYVWLHDLIESVRAWLFV